MSRYILLLLLNIPFITAALVSTFVGFKLNKVSKRRFIFTMLFWIVILIGLAFAEQIYGFLFSNNLTNTEPLSLFDVIQITAIVILLYFVNRSRTKVEELDKRVQDLHQEVSIRLSDGGNKQQNEK